jgi:hypothetical protein
VSREVRRVPLDFDWPLDKVWGGYVMPDTLKQTPCPDCENGGTPAAEWLRILCSRIQGLGGDIRDQNASKPPHPYLAHDPDPHTTRGAIDPVTRQWTEYPRLIRPSADILPLLAGLTGYPQERFLEPMAGDYSYNIAVRIVAAAGLDPDTWGLCATCTGEGLLDAYDGQSADIEAWTSTEPPTGDGWQLWETVSDGSPISPVCATAEDLAIWMSSNANPRERDRVPYDTALCFIHDGWAPSAVSGPDIDGVISGIQAVGTQQEGPTP